MLGSLLGSCAENSTSSVHFRRYVSNVLTIKHTSQIAKVMHRVPIGVLLADVVESASLIVGESRDLCWGEPCGAVNGGVDVAGLES